MTKQYMQFNEFKTILFEAIDDEKAAWMGGIFWKLLSNGSTNSLLIYYAVLRNKEIEIQNSIDGLLKRECIDLEKAAGMEGSLDRFVEVAEDFKHKKEYKLYKNEILLTSTSKDSADELRRKISNKLSSFLMEQKMFVGFEMTERNIGQAIEIKSEADGVKAAIASVKKMAENSDSFGGWEGVKKHLKKLSDMPAKDFFIEYGDHLLAALAFKAVSGLVKLVKNKKNNSKGGETPPINNPKWKDGPIVITSKHGESHGKAEIPLSNYIENYNDKLKIELDSQSSRYKDLININNNTLVYNDSTKIDNIPIKLNLLDKDNKSLGTKEITLKVESKKRV